MSEKYYKGIKICCENCCNDACKRGGRCLLKGMVTSQLLWTPSDEAYEARLDELTAFVKRVASSQIPSVRHGTLNEIELIHEARVLLHRESERK